MAILSTTAVNVPKAGIPASALKRTLINGGTAGSHTVTGMAVGDELISVDHISTAASVATIADLTSEFTVAAGAVDNTGGTDTTNDQLYIIWIDKT